MNRELIVSRYKENVDWLQSLTNKVYLYNKGPDCPRYPCTNLPNIGREANTYLYWLQYSSIQDHVIYTFTQGNPFDHCPNFLDQLSIPVTNFTFHCKEVFISKSNGDPHHGNLFPGKLYAYLFKKECPEQLHFGPGAIFSVPGILLNQSNKRIIELAYRLSLEYEKTSDFVKFPWQIERLWWYILSGESR